MKEITEEAAPPVRKSNRFRRVLKVLIPRWNRDKKIPVPVPWAIIRERKGSKTLEWGMGDGKMFGCIPLDPEVVFSVDPSGVKLMNRDGPPVLIGSPENEPANLLLSRKIEKTLRNRLKPFRIAIAILLGVLVFLVVLGGWPGFGHLPSLSQSLPGGGPSALSDLPPSMSSGLTCNTH